MSSTFKCPKCGRFNNIGQEFCAFCNEKFEYHCIKCGVIVDCTYTSCPNCKTSLYWASQIPDQVIDTPSNAHTPGKPSIDGPQQGQPQGKKKRISRTLVFLTLLFILIVAGFYVVTLLIESDKNVYIDYHNKNTIWIDNIHNDILINESALGFGYNII